MGQIFGFFWQFVYLGTIAAGVWVVWLVVSCLRRMSRGIEDMAETLRRIEGKMDGERRDVEPG